jgi:Na+-transporting NADH:ubiquinone oxidoreductase subunit B
VSGAPHVRNPLTLARAMQCVWAALVPCIAWASYNTGFQANEALRALGREQAPGWRGALLDVSGLGIAPDDALSCVLHGLLYLVPLFAVVLAVGRAWELAFARLRGREPGEGLSVIAILLALSVPPGVPLWQAALAMSFGLVMGREVFGGTGRNFVNPGLAGLAFLYFAYPGSVSQPAVFWGVDGVSAATPLAAALSGGPETLARSGISWWQAFVGRVPGTPGETSTLAVGIGAALLIWLRVASWRVLAGGVLGLVAGVELYDLIAEPGMPGSALAWHWHLVLGSFAFGLVFFATDPVTSAITDTGRWIYGAWIGLVVALIRLANPAYVEGTLLAVLLGNVTAPLIDHVVVRLGVRRRRARLA